MLDVLHLYRMAAVDFSGMLAHVLPIDGGIRKKHQQLNNINQTSKRKLMNRKIDLYIENGNTIFRYCIYKCRL